jgi:alpha-N-arabinofuranosidase
MYMFERRTYSCLVVALLSMFSTLAAAHVSAQITESAPLATGPVHLRISRPLTPTIVPDTLFGSFLEPIRLATYGGLWADVVENPSFEDGLWSSGNAASLLKERPELMDGSNAGLPLPWEPLDKSQGRRYAPIRGDAANSFQSMLIMALPGKEVGILEKVYLPVQRELTYTGSVWVKHVEGGPEVKVTLRRRGRPDEILALANINAPSATWTKYPFTLQLKAGSVVAQDPLDLVISLSDEARAQIDNIGLVPADAVEGMDPDVVALARDLHSPVVRFGGNYTSAYDWHDGMGLPDKRVSKVNVAWGIPEYNTFGTDEFLNFCRLIGAEPQIALNLGTGSPREAAEWVRYVNDHWGNHRGGLIWELGNELWGSFQVGYPTRERIAARTLAFSTAVRNADPHARLIATGGDEDFFQNWNAQQLMLPSGTFQYLSTHFVVNDTVQLANASYEFHAQASLALPWGMASKMQEIRQQAVSAGRPDVKVAFTEWLIVPDGHAGPGFSNLGGALFAGGFLNMLMRNADAVGVSDMTGIVEFAGIVKKHAQAYGAPAYWVLREYASAHPRTLLSVATDTPTYSVVQGIRRLPDIKDVPYLDVVAAQSADGKTLLLFCVNRHLSRPESAEIDLSALGINKGKASISTITGDSILTENDELDPTKVSAQVHPESFQGKLAHSFPPRSITVISVAQK